MAIYVFTGKDIPFEKPPSTRKERLVVLKAKTGESGVESIFIQTYNNKGYKIFPTAKIAKTVRERQARAAKHKIAPKVLSKIKKCYVKNLDIYDATDENITSTNRYGYMYETQIAKMDPKKIDKLFDNPTSTFEKQFNRLESIMESYKWNTDDLHTNNLGFIKRRLVCIDFGDFSI